MLSAKKLVVVEVASLGWEFISRQATDLNRLRFKKAQPVFPALTCPVQASFRTASLPREHGMIANGLFFRDLRKVMFWEQSAALVKGQRLWPKNFREDGHRVGMIFWQQSLGEKVDLLLSPSPIHKHSGGMIQACYGHPYNLEERITKAIGRRFNLAHYWGPLASKKSTAWVIDATCFVMQTPDLAPELLFTYLPHLDYDLQRYGPGSQQASEAFQVVQGWIEQLRIHAESTGYDYLFFGDYAIEPATGEPVFPNRCFRESGLLQPRLVKGRAYTNFYSHAAFAMVDHQIAHVFTANEKSAQHARESLEKLKGVHKILDQSAQRQFGIDHPRSGELVLVAEKGHWFAYPWWTDKKEAPDYAGHVDIHNKPGYDPCELFFGWPPWNVSLDAEKVGGSHGRGGTENAIAWASSCKFETEPASIIELACAVQKWLEKNFPP